MDFSHDERFTVAVWHVGSENHVVFADELDNLGQENIVGFRAEKEIAFSHILHRRQGMLRRCLRMKRRELVSRASKAMIHSLEYKMDPLAACLQEGNSQV